ncbi:glycosyl hydrolase family 18 protein [Streptomyces tsukubensis]|uniref:chitinase n=1 Tax=Streptomyces tsukubensis TaxID=83656 RepID=A0A1V4AGA9_9ACTN|nr:glycosyl hydrolase family 18 protein [Streptomyces tsukubensis]OON82641.1 chitinase [Streptomyces tsukubensis]QFR92188.1 chitinase [Streptomyces tsukubensis]
MRRMRSLRSVLTATVTAIAAAGLAATGAGSAQAASPLPARVFAPYFESWTGESPAALADQSGARHLTMAFLQTASAGSCTPYWNGDTGSPVSSATFGSDIKKIQANGGDVIPSFGGYTADTTGTEIADSCGDVDQIAAAYEKVITTYDVARLDMDIEVDSLDNSAGVDRRNKAIKKVQDWAAASGRKVEISYTLPTTTTGLASSGLAVLKNAVTNGARVDVANIMTFDYYDNATHNMANDTQTAATGLYNQLAKLYPSKSAAQLWGMIGVTEMPGVDDFGPAETFTLANAKQVYSWAVSKGINTLSFWALQRDNGSCPGGAAADNCSGIQQNTWDFTHVFAPFTSGTTAPADDFSVTASPASGSVAAGKSATTAVKTAVTAGEAQTLQLTVDGAPKGVTASLSPTSLKAGASATLTLDTTSAAASGTYDINVTAQSPSGSHTATYSLTVTGGSGSVCTSTPWATGSVYTGGQQVSYEGHNWKAKWWTTGEEPGTTGEWGVWQDLGPC